MLHTAVWAKNFFVAICQHPHICSQSVCMKFFFKMNIHPEGPNFGYFLFQQWYPRPKKLSGTNFHAFSCPSIHVVTNFLKWGKISL